MIQSQSWKLVEHKEKKQQTTATAAQIHKEENKTPQSQWQSELRVSGMSPFRSLISRDGKEKWKIMRYLFFHPFKCSSLGHDHFGVRVKLHPWCIYSKTQNKVSMQLIVETRLHHSSLRILHDLAEGRGKEGFSSKYVGQQHRRW